jgi:hypothetical protein
MDQHTLDPIGEDKSVGKWGQVVAFVLLGSLLLQGLAFATAIYAVKIGLGSPFRYVGF